MSASTSGAELEIDWNAIGGADTFERQAITFTPFVASSFVGFESDGGFRNLVGTENSTIKAQIYLRLNGTWILFGENDSIRGPYRSEFPLDGFKFLPLDLSTGPIDGINITNTGAGATEYFGMTYRGTGTRFKFVTGPNLDLDLALTTVTGCKSVVGTVTLYEPAPTEGVKVSLTDTLAAAAAPSTLFIPAGANAKSFTIRTSAVDAQQIGVVAATAGGVIRRQSLTVRPMGLTSITLTPTTVVGSKEVTGKATLECKAGPGPITVDLSSNNPGVASPVAASIVVPQGLQSANFDVTTNAVQSKSYATIAGTANGITKSKKLTVNVAAAVRPTSLKFGSVAVGTTSAALGTVLSNKGTVPFTVDSIALTGTYGSWYAQTSNCPASLAAGATCTISVTFTPQAAATKSAKLTIATSATSTPLSVSLSGTGI